MLRNFVNFKKKRGIIDKKYKTAGGYIFKFMS